MGEIMGMYLLNSNVELLKLYPIVTNMIVRITVLLIIIPYISRKTTNVLRDKFGSINKRNVQLEIIFLYVGNTIILMSVISVGIPDLWLEKLLDLKELVEFPENSELMDVKFINILNNGEFMSVLIPIILPLEVIQEVEVRKQEVIQEIRMKKYKEQIKEMDFDFNDYILLL